MHLGEKVGRSGGLWTNLRLVERWQRGTGPRALAREDLFQRWLERADMNKGHSEEFFFTPTVRDR